MLLVAFLTAISTALPGPDKASLHSFVMKDIDGNDVDLSEFEGKVLLVVNVASECGFTPQYENLVSLHNKYKDRGLVVLGFPANNFGKQEPGTNQEIKKFCMAKYNVTFPMFSKISVKGKDQDPLFTFLTSTENRDFTGAIKWNFEKFLVGKDGELVGRFRTRVLPNSKEVLEAIEKALNH